MELRPIGIAEIIGGAAILALALYVAATARSRPSNRLLAVLFAIEGAAQAVWGVHDYVEGRGLLAERAMQVGMLGISLSSFLYLLLVRRLAAPLAAPLRTRVGLAVAALTTLAPGAAGVLYLFLHPGALSIATGEMLPGAGPYIAVFGSALIAAYAYALATAVWAWRRSPAGTTMRKQAGAFALAFGARDVFFIAALALNVLGAFIVNASAVSFASYALWPASTFVYALLLSYGLLRLQLFDLDLRIKVGISRGTVAGIILVCVFVVAKIVENYLSRTVGFVAGSIVAGALLFLVPKLNKVGEKVADTALPQVQPTSEYLVYKKLEVYRAAVEGALETGNEIDASERHMLSKLRAKLGLTPSDAQAIEDELVGASS